MFKKQTCLDCSRYCCQASWAFCLFSMLWQEKFVFLLTYMCLNSSGYSNNSWQGKALLFVVLCSGFFYSTLRSPGITMTSHNPLQLSLERWQHCICTATFEFCLACWYTDIYIYIYITHFTSLKPNWCM